MVRWPCRPRSRRSWLLFGLSRLAQASLEPQPSAPRGPRLRQKHRDEPRFGVIGYGTLGGKELGYGSDLDVVFVFDDEHEDAQEAYAAFVRKLITWLTVKTGEGDLFEIDTALRPNGNSGLLVTNFESYADYQENRGSNTAWTWEHQAMTRARMVPPRCPAAHGALALQAAEPPESAPLRAVQARAGEAGAAALSPEGPAPGPGSGPAAGRMVPPSITSPDVPADNLVARFDAVRHAVITAPRDQAALRGEIVAMREKMRAAHPVKQGLFDVKHSPGGMVDAEFVTQYLVLAHSGDHPGLQPNLGNISLLRRAEEAGLLPEGVGQRAADAYRALRRVQHRARLDEQPTQVAPDTLAGERAAIQRLWQVVFE